MHPPRCHCDNRRDQQDEPDIDRSQIAHQTSVKRIIASHTKMALHDLRFAMQVIRRALEHDMSIVLYIHEIGKAQYRHDGSKRNTPQAGMGCQLWVYADGD